MKKMTLLISVVTWVFILAADNVMALLFVLEGTASVQTDHIITAVADSHVYSSGLDVNYGEASSISITGWKRKSYIKFDVSSLTEDVSEATLNLILSAVPTSTNPIYGVRVYGLNDDLYQDDWGENIITYSNAPANTEGPGHYPTGDATLLGAFAVAINTPVGTRVDFSSDGLTSFLNADSDGFITLILVQDRNVTPENYRSIQFASRENAVCDGPSLSIPIIFRCGFEGDEYYSIGDVTGKNQWTTSGNNLKEVEGGGNTMWSGSTGDQWLMVYSYLGYATTPVFNTKEYDSVTVSFDMRPAGHNTDTSYWGGIIRFYDENSALMTSVKLQRTNVNAGVFVLYDAPDQRTTNIPWNYSGTNTTLNVRVKFYQVDDIRMWQCTINGEVQAAGKIGAETGTLSQIKFQGGLGTLFDGLACYDTLSIMGTRRQYIAHPANTTSLGGDLLDHGVVSAKSTHRGLVSTVDGDGNNVVLAWLMDSRGCYGLLQVDTATGVSTEYSTPFINYYDQVPYASILSSQNKFYSHFNNRFVEFDPERKPEERGITYEMAGGRSMSMTEDDNGVIWSVTHPDCGVVSFNPGTRQVVEYGTVYAEEWDQYPRSIASDDTGWIYIASGKTLTQLVGLNPQTEEVKTFVPEVDRVAHASPSVVRDQNGKVYGHAGGSTGKWYQLYNGVAVELAIPPTINELSIITGSQDLFHGEFLDGTELLSFDLNNRLFVVLDPLLEELRTENFDYPSEGTRLISVALAPDNTVAVGCVFPMRFGNYDPDTDEIIDYPFDGNQCNTMTRQGDRLYIGTYPSGSLLEWVPSMTWRPGDDATANPYLFGDNSPVLGRPHDLLAHPDGETLILGGTPGYSHTGGGMLFWNADTLSGELLGHMDLLPNHSVKSMVMLSSDKLLVGSTIEPGNGGETLAEVAELYILNMATKTIDWSSALFTNTTYYYDLCLSSQGLVYGFTSRDHFFVFNPNTKTIVYEQNTETAGFGSACLQQGPRVFVHDDDSNTYVIFENGIGEVNSSTYEITMLLTTTFKIRGGGCFYDGKIYFVGDSHLYSYAP